MAFFPQTGRQLMVGLGLVSAFGVSLGLGLTAGQQWLFSDTTQGQVQPTNDREQLLIVVREFGIMQARLDRVEALASKFAGKEFAAEKAVADANTEAGLPACDSDKIRDYHQADITRMLPAYENMELLELRSISQKDGENNCEAIVKTRIGRMKIPFSIAWADKTKQRFGVAPTGLEPLDYGVAK